MEDGVGGDLADLINGLLEFFSAALVLWNVRRLYIDKMVRGVSIVPTLFFDAWGLWNLYFYPSLDLWLSFAGGAFLVGANVWWTALAISYMRRERAQNQQGKAGSAIRFEAPGVREASQDTGS